MSCEGGELPLPWGEGWGEGIRTLDRPYPLTRRATLADLSPWERWAEQVANDSISLDPSLRLPQIRELRRHHVLVLADALGDAGRLREPAHGVERLLAD